MRGRGGGGDEHGEQLLGGGGGDGGGAAGSRGGGGGGGGGGGRFDLSATVRNVGDAASAATPLRYYRSSDASISTSDAEVGTDAVGALSAGADGAGSLTLNAPTTPGTYYVRGRGSGRVGHDGQLLVGGRG